MKSKAIIEKICARNPRLKLNGITRTLMVLEATQVAPYTRAQKLILNNRGLAVKIAQEYSNVPDQLQDVIQMAYEGLARAAIYFLKKNPDTDPDYGDSGFDPVTKKWFRTYAQQVVRNELNRQYRGHSAYHSHEFTDLDAPQFDDEESETTKKDQLPDPADTADVMYGRLQSKDMAKLLDQAIENIQDKNVRKLMALQRKGNYSYRDLAPKFNVSPVMIGRWYHLGISEIRKYLAAHKALTV